MSKKLVFTAVMVALLVLIGVPKTRQVLFEQHVMQAVDTRSIAYVDQSLKNAGAAFLLARGFNAVVSVFQESEVQLEPGGVGVSLALGQALDPVNDLIERFSWVMLASLTSLGIQRFLIEITPLVSIQILLSAALCFLLAGLWLPRKPGVNVTQVGLTLLCLSILLRFAVPAMAFLNHQVYVAFLEDRHNQSVEMLSASTSALESYALDETTAGKQPEAREKLPESEQGWLSQMMDQFDQTVEQGKRMFDVNAKFKAVQSLAHEMVETIVDLIVVFILNTIVLPIIFLYGIIKLGQLVTSRALNILPPGTLKRDT
jgi:hypothetical protein